MDVHNSSDGKAQLPVSFTTRVGCTGVHAAAVQARLHLHGLHVGLHQLLHLLAVGRHGQVQAVALPAHLCTFHTLLLSTSTVRNSLVTACAHVHCLHRQHAPRTSCITCALPGCRCQAPHHVHIVSTGRTVA